MRSALLDHLRCPVTGDRLVAHDFEGGADEIVTGLLVGTEHHHVYPVLRGVPVMLPESVPEDLLARFPEQIEAARGAYGDWKLGSSSADFDWSFSREWEAHYDHGTPLTWGKSADARREQMFFQAGLEPDATGKLFLDAGSGNGQMAAAMAESGATVIGIDYSVGPFLAEERRTADRVHYVRGDLRRPPFPPGTFDFVYSSGVLHHTPNTRATFLAVAPLVKDGGRFYLWLYKRSERFFERTMRGPVRSGLRWLIARSPAFLQDAWVRSLAGLKWLWYRVRGRRPLHMGRTLVDLYDQWTPKWIHRHSPYEVAWWFFEAGYSEPTLCHWDNRLGFGMVATRRPRDMTAGENWGKPRDQVRRRFWDA